MSRYICLGLVVGLRAATPAWAQESSVFTYQGQLKVLGAPLNGTADFEFGLWDDPTTGAMVGGPVAVDNVTVANGLFTVQLDFGVDVFANGFPRWLGIAVRSPAGGGAFTTLTPRQPLAATPYAIHTRGINVGSNGYVGLNTWFPNYRLHVVDAGARTLFAHNFATSGTTHAGWFENDSPNGRAITGWTKATSGVTGAADFWCDSPDGWGVQAYASADTGTNYGGVFGSDSSSGTGVYAFAGRATGTTYGVYALSYSTSGCAVYGRATANSGGAYGGWLESESSSGIGVYGLASSDSGTTEGVYGRSVSTSGRGVFGEAAATTGTTYGGRFESDSTSGRGVFAWATASSGTTYGVRGQTSSASGYGVYSVGDYGGTGAKYFIQPHPTDPSKEIRFVCLEGNESGTYFRGSAQLAGGRAVIEVPEEFRLVSESSGLTVQVTALGPDAGLWVESKDLDRVVVRGNRDIEFDYFINGVRRGYGDLKCIQENHAYVPETRGMPYGTQLREGHRRILVENGILNPDFTPNDQTAARMGWLLSDPIAEDDPTERTD